MTPTWSLAKSGNVVKRTLSGAAILDIKSKLNEFSFADEEVPEQATCSRCLVPASFVAVLGESPNDRLWVYGRSVYLGSRRLKDPDLKFRQYYEQLFSTLKKQAVINPIGSPLDTPTAAPQMVAPQDAAPPDEPPAMETDKGDLRFKPCPCGGPADFEDWARANTMAANSCYNFAVKDLWIDKDLKHLGGARGALGSDDPQAWIAKFEGDGLVKVDDWNTKPDGANEGWHIALALQTDANDTGFHCLRLDGDHWSHKMSGNAPQLCDFEGNAILKNDITKAKLCDFKLKAFFWVRPGLHVS